ncbi:hypothetical protein ACQ858_22270 [Variovorax ureilyticus]|uniref:hypothetical protein n=1 Tax=Variovorax ureilyticus TaxID=1836198 RepID=UPI003D67D4BB
MVHLVVEWAVLRLPTGERRLIGVNKETREVLISDPVDGFWPGQRLIADSSGQHYILTDTGLVSVPARRAWREWCRDHGEPGFREVTEEYEDALNAAGAQK